MADDAKTDPASTGQSQTAQAAPKTDAAGKDLGAVSGSAPAPAPASANSPATPSPSLSKTVTQSSDDAGSAKTDPVKSLIEDHATDDKDGKAAIINVASGVQSLANPPGMVEKAESQSPEMQTGAQVAHDNAFQGLVKRVETLCQTLGKEVAAEVTKELGKFHDAEQVVEKVLKQAGVID